MKRNHLAIIPALSALAFLFSGCAGATRLPKRARGPAGENLENKQLDLTFLDAPGTQRQEVVNRLSSVDTTYANPRLFWGRWSESKWGYWWFVASTNDARGDAKRVWHTHNLLVAFDENGTVRQKEVIDNDRSLWPELHAQLAAAPALDLAEPVSLEVSGFHNLARITLGTDSVELNAEQRERASATDFAAENCPLQSWQAEPQLPPQLDLPHVALHRKNGMGQECFSVRQRDQCRHAVSVSAASGFSHHALGVSARLVWRAGFGF